MGVPASLPGDKGLFIPIKAKGYEGDRSLDSIIINDSYSLIAEALYQVNTAVMRSIAHRPPGATRFTDPSPSAGKTGFSLIMSPFIAMNGNRELLADDDRRRPPRPKIFQPSGEPGLSNFLTGNTWASEFIWSTEISNLYFIPAGAIPPNPVSFLESQVPQELVKTLRPDFQHGIFATPQ